MAWFKKKKDIVPPDVGKEPEEEKESSKAPKPKKEQIPPSIGPSRGYASNAYLERIKLELQALKETKKATSERFNRVSEQIGELRSMLLTTQKDIQKAQKDSTVAVDIVKAVKPEEVAANMNRTQSKIESLRAKIESNEQVFDTVVDEMREIKNKMAVFRGTDAVMKLNDEIKDELIEIQKIKAIVEGHSDKVEQMFVETQKHLRDIEKVKSRSEEFEEDVKKLKKDVTSIKVKGQTYATKDALEQVIEEIAEIFKRNKESVSKTEFKNAMVLIDKLEKELKRLGDANNKILLYLAKNVKHFKNLNQEIHKEQKIGGEQELGVIIDYIEQLERRVENIEGGKKPITKTPDSKVSAQDITVEGEDIKTSKENGLVLTFVSPKSGIGKTASVANIAVSLSDKKDKKVLVVDTILNQNNIGYQISSVYPSITIQDIISRKVHFSKAIRKYSENFHILPVDLKESLLLDDSKDMDKKYEFIIKYLSKFYDFILIDSPSGSRRETEINIKSGDGTIVVFTPDPTIVGNSGKLRKKITDLEKPIVAVILNKVTRSKYEISKDQIQRALGVNAVIEIPYDPKMDDSIKKQKPIVKYKPLNKISRIYNKIGDRIIEIR